MPDQKYDRKMTDRQQERVIEEGRSDYKDGFHAVDSPYHWHHQREKYEMWLKGFDMEKRLEEKHGD